MLIALEAGAEDVKDEDGTYSITTPPELLKKLRNTWKSKTLPLKAPK